MLNRFGRVDASAAPSRAVAGARDAVASAKEEVASRVKGELAAAEAKVQGLTDGAKERLGR